MNKNEHRLIIRYDAEYYLHLFHAGVAVRFGTTSRSNIFNHIRPRPG